MHILSEEDFIASALDDFEKLVNGTAKHRKAKSHKCFLVDLWEEYGNEESMLERLQDSRFGWDLACTYDNDYDDSDAEEHLHGGGLKRTIKDPATGKPTAVAWVKFRCVGEVPLALKQRALKRDCEDFRELDDYVEMWTYSHGLRPLL